ncbi:hypothetical protein IGJ98_001893 [Enterococcus sp. DIV0996a]
MLRFLAYRGKSTLLYLIFYFLSLFSSLFSCSSSSSLITRSTRSSSFCNSRRLRLNSPKNPAKATSIPPTNFPKIPEVEPVLGNCLPETSSESLVPCVLVVWSFVWLLLDNPSLELLSLSTWVLTI